MAISITVIETMVISKLDPEGVGGMNSPNTDDNKGNIIVRSFTHTPPFLLADDCKNLGDSTGGNTSSYSIVTIVVPREIGNMTYNGYVKVYACHNDYFYKRGSKKIVSWHGRMMV